MATPLLPVITLNKGFLGQCEFGQIYSLAVSLSDECLGKRADSGRLPGVVPVMVIYLTFISVTESVLSGMAEADGTCSCDGNLE